MRELELLLRSHALAPIGPIDAQLIPGGRSNLTFFVSDATHRRWVVRRPPLGNLLPGAHDVVREYRAIRALSSTAVPVPTPIGFGRDSADVPFYVMDEVLGLVIRDTGDAAELETHAPARIATELARALAALHSVDVDAVGLGDLGKGLDYGRRQMVSWQRQAEHHRRAPNAAADALYARLLNGMPVQHEVTLVHGDYRLDNAVFARSGDLRAVLDWELCTRGDPLIDLGVFMYYWTEPGDPVRPFVDPATTEWGWPDRAEILAAYEAASGRSVERISWYLGYAAWRLAAVFEGVRGRAAKGAYGDADTAEQTRLGSVVDALVCHSAELLDQDEHAGR